MLFSCSAVFYFDVEQKQTELKDYVNRDYFKKKKNLKVHQELCK